MIIRLKYKVQHTKATHNIIFLHKNTKSDFPTYDYSGFLHNNALTT